MAIFVDRIGHVGFNLSVPTGCQGAGRASGKREVSHGPLYCWTQPQQPVELLGEILHAHLALWVDLWVYLSR